MPFQGEARRQIKDRFHSPPFDSLLDDYTSRLRPHVEKEFHYGSGITADHLKQLMGKAIASANGKATLSPAPFDSVLSSITKVKGNQSNVREGWISTRVEHPDVLSVTYDKETDSFSAGRANSSTIISESRTKADGSNGILAFNTMYTSNPIRSKSAQDCRIANVKANERTSPPELFEGLADTIRRYARERRLI